MPVLSYPEDRLSELRSLENGRKQGCLSVSRLTIATTASSEALQIVPVAMVVNPNANGYYAPFFTIEPLVPSHAARLPRFWMVRRRRRSFQRAVAARM